MLICCVIRGKFFGFFVKIFSLGGVVLDEFYINVKMWKVSLGSCVVVVLELFLVFFSGYIWELWVELRNWRFLGWDYNLFLLFKGRGFFGKVGFSFFF